MTVQQRQDGAGEHRPGSLLERLGAAFGRRAPAAFEPSADPTLLAFAELFADSGLTAFAATKQARVDVLTLVYDCWTESTRGPGEAPETFSVAWSPNRQGKDPVVGFRTGEDSPFLGTAPTVGMPQDERTDALLLLVTSRFVHLSAQQEQPVPVIRGVVDTEDGDYRFLTLDPGAGAGRAREGAVQHDPWWSRTLDAGRRAGGRDTDAPTRGRAGPAEPVGRCRTPARPAGPAAGADRGRAAPPRAVAGGGDAGQDRRHLRGAATPRRVLVAGRGLPADQTG